MNSTAQNQQAIAIIDDDPVLRQLLKTKVTQAGFRVVLPADSAEVGKFCEQACQMVAKETPTIVVCDLTLPREDAVLCPSAGVKLIAKLRKLRLPMHIVALSGTVDESVLAGLNKLGVFTFHNKATADGVNNLVDSLKTLATTSPPHPARFL